MQEQANHLTQDYIESLLEWKGQGFDLRTHIVDPKSGQIIKEQPYRRVVDKEKGTYYIRDGKRYQENGMCMDPVETKRTVKNDTQLSK